MPKVRAVVVDTNVAVAASGRTPHASTDCEAACRRSVLEITRGQMRLVLDDGFEIFDEYRSELSLQGQPGVGDMFLKWVHDHQFDPSCCERVALTPHPSLGYEQFPDDRALQAFDWDDRKFVAIALASATEPRVLNAVDSDWWEYERILSRHGVVVQFVCEDQAAAWRVALKQR